MYMRLYISFAVCGPREMNKAQRKLNWRTLRCSCIKSSAIMSTSHKMRTKFVLWPRRPVTFPRAKRARSIWGRRFANSRGAPSPNVTPLFWKCQMVEVGYTGWPSRISLCKTNMLYLDLNNTKMKKFWKIFEKNCIIRAFFCRARQF